MSLPTPAQVASLPQALKELEKFLWDHPTGGTYTPTLEGAIVDQLSQELREAKWSVSLTNDGKVTMHISPGDKSNPR